MTSIGIRNQHGMISLCEIYNWWCFVVNHNSCCDYSIPASFQHISINIIMVNYLISLSLSIVIDKVYIILWGACKSIYTTVVYWCKLLVFLCPRHHIESLNVWLFLVIIITNALLLIMVNYKWSQALGIIITLSA